jgi:type IV secretory pathway TrbF-like protein
VNKYKLYKIYKKFIREHEQHLEQNLRLRRDYTNFLYTIVNLDPELVNKYYAENDRVARPAINEYIKKVDDFFRKYNMQEFVAVRKVTRVDDFNWKVEFGFSLFNSKKRAKRFFYTTLAIVVLTILSLIIF